jgi:hypothetical protein
MGSEGSNPSRAERDWRCDVAKGRTNQPLLILVLEQWAEHPTIVALREQGHDIRTSGQAADFDLVLLPNAHQWNDMMWDFLPAALAAARKRKREAK